MNIAGENKRTKIKITRKGGNKTKYRAQEDTKDYQNKIGSYQNMSTNTATETTTGPEEHRGSKNKLENKEHMNNQLTINRNSLVSKNRQL